MAFVFSNHPFGSALTAALEAADTAAQISAEDADKFAVPTGGDLQRCILRDDTGAFEIIDISANDEAGGLTVVRARESTAARDWAAGSLIEQYLSKAVLESLQ